jgi:hypothetical protein
MCGTAPPEPARVDVLPPIGASAAFAIEGRAPARAPSFLFSKIGHRPFALRGTFGQTLDPLPSAFFCLQYLTDCPPYLLTNRVIV